MRYLLILLVCFGCRSAQHDLSKAERLIERAKLNGANVEVDTVYKRILFKASPISFHTVVNSPNWNDTLIVRAVGKDSIIVRIKRIPGKRGEPEKVYVQADCPEREATQEVPVAVNQHISAGYSLWQLIILAIVSYLVGGVTFPWILKRIR